jgi:hypothetical protein
MALLLCPPSLHVTVPVPSVPLDSMCQDHPTLPLPPTVCAEPLNDAGALPVEYSTLAVHTAPGELYAYKVGYDPYETGLGLIDARTENDPKGRTVGWGLLAGGKTVMLFCKPPRRRSKTLPCHKKRRLSWATTRVTRVPGASESI